MFFDILKSSSTIKVTVACDKTLFVATYIQYSPKIMHAQEVAQELLAPQEHASSRKK